VAADTADGGDKEEEGAATSFVVGTDEDDDEAADEGVSAGVGVVDGGVSEDVAAASVDVAAVVSLPPCPQLGFPVHPPPPPCQGPQLPQP
jgi:hypothetical protein